MPSPIHPDFGRKLAELLAPLISISSVQTHRHHKTGAVLVIISEGHTASVYSWHVGDLGPGFGPGFGYAGTLTDSMAAAIGFGGAQ